MTDIKNCDGTFGNIRDEKKAAFIAEFLHEHMTTLQEAPDELIEAAHEYAEKMLTQF